MTIASQSPSNYLQRLRKNGLSGLVRKAPRKAFNLGGLWSRAALQRAAALWRGTDRWLLGRTAGDFAGVDDIATALARDDGRAWLFAPADRARYVAAVRERFPAGVAATLAEAERLRRHEFSFLGRSFTAGATIDWHLDLESRARWPRDYYEWIDRWAWSEQRRGDFKLVWELNRHQHLVTLGKAYWLSDDEGFAREAAAQIVGWVRQNPVGFGVNWYSSLEIGVRLIAWALALHFFRASPEFLRLVGRPLLHSLHAQAAFLRAHLSSDWPVPNNHILGEAASLIVAGSLFPQFRAAADWRYSGLELFRRELARQTFSEGANREQAMGYHRFVCDFLLYVVVLARRGAIAPQPELEGCLERMLTYMLLTTCPDGTAPMLGDADDGRGYMLSEEVAFWDFRPSLAAGAALFGRADFKAVAGGFGEEAFWLLGPEGAAAFDAIVAAAPHPTSAAFMEAGHYVLRDGWTADSDYAFFKSGPFGLGGAGYCAHGHCDLLSLVLYLGDRPVLQDAGTFTYHGPLREHFRRTAAHNTLLVDGREQSTPRDPFSWVAAPAARCVEWTGTRVAGTLALPDGVEWRRSVEHCAPGRWEIVDTLAGEGVHRLEWFFHLDRALRLTPDPAQRRLLVTGPGVAAAFEPPQRDVTISVGEDWLSWGYGVRQAGSVLRGTWQGQLQPTGIQFRWLIIGVV